MLKQFPISLKLNLLVGLTLALVIGLLGYINITREKGEIVETMAKSSQHIAGIIVDDLKRYMPERDIDNIELTMERIVSERQDIKNISLLNKNGRIVLSTEKREKGNSLTKESHACIVCHRGFKPKIFVPEIELRKIIKSDSGESFLQIVNPVYNKKQCFESPCHVHSPAENVLGLIKTDFSLEGIRRSITRRNLETITTALVAIFAISLITGFFIRKYVIRPVNKVISGMEKVAGGAFDSRIEIENRDEIGRLADGFNFMTAELYQKTRELQKTRDYLLGIVENSADLIITVNPEGLIETFNRGAEKILGYDRSEIIGKRAEILFSRPEERAYAISQLQEKENVVNFETQFLKKDGSPVDIILTISRLRDPDGNPMGTLGISKDVTEYKRLQKQLIQSESLSAIGEAVASITHSMKNILNSLKGGSYIIMSGLNKKDINLIQEGWEVAEGGIKRISQLAMEMLDFTRSHRLSVESSSINDIVSEACEAMKKTPEVQGGIELKFEPFEDIPPLMVDRKSIYNALLNLISNAIDACMERDYEPGERGWVKVRTYIEKEKCYACIDVMDNGGGIPDDIREEIFKPFFSTKFNKGTGLGLAITMKIVREHNGILSLDTIPGHGSTFTIRLPFIY